LFSGVSTLATWVTVEKQAPERSAAATSGTLWMSSAATIRL
jgi:hypothetical protein